MHQESIRKDKRKESSEANSICISDNRWSLNLQFTLFCGALFNKKSMWFLSQRWIIITISNDSIIWVLPATLIKFNVVKPPLLKCLKVFEVFFITMLNNNHDPKRFNSMSSTGKANTIQCVKTQNSDQDTMVRNFKFLSKIHDSFLPS